VEKGQIVKVSKDKNGIVKAGRCGGTYAHKDIAFEFASWISPQFKISIIKEFQRLKEEEFKQLGWDIKRNPAKINYRIHTDAIKENLVPAELTPKQVNLVYATEADVLNMALHKDFPQSPHAVLDPDICWFPADEALRETSMEKLMPPLVSQLPNHW